MPDDQTERERAMVHIDRLRRAIDAPKPPPPIPLPPVPERDDDGPDA